MSKATSNGKLDERPQDTVSATEDPKMTSLEEGKRACDTRPLIYKKQSSRTFVDEQKK